MIYLDTGCLLKLYFPEPESAIVARIVAGSAIVYLGLHELELTNALELKRFRREASPKQLDATRALVEDDQRARVLFRPGLEWEDVLREAAALARSWSRVFGCRSLDILHCAAAKSLGALPFVTTDARQKKLARKLGLVCPRV